MALWTNISNALVAVGAKPFATTLQALRDNPVAIVEGAPDAPRMLLPSLERLNPGTQIRSRNDATLVLADNASGTLHSFGFLQHGTVRCSFEKVSGSGNLIVTRTRNNASTDLLSTSTNAVHTVDVAVIPGDLISFRGTTGIGGSLNVRNARLQTNGQDIWPGAGVRLEGNRSAT